MKSIIDTASAEVGYIEKPGNRTKYGQWFGLDGVAWCGIFVSWCYAKSGKLLGKIGFTKGFAGCQTAVAHFTKTKELTTNPVEGDIVFFDWNGDGRYDHTGIFVKKVDDIYFDSIEGNTSTANQSNGGSVMLRKRTYKGCVFVHPKVNV